MARSGWRERAETASDEAEAKRAWLIQLATRCVGCGHTEAWHVVDGRCAHQMGKFPPCGCERRG